MRLPSKTKYRLSLILPLLMIFSGCATQPLPAVPSACAWATLILPDDGYRTRWTASEMRQVDVYDQMVVKKCRQHIPAK